MSRSFIADKHSFFKEITSENTVEFVKIRAREPSFAFLTTYRDSVTHEYDELSAVLNKTSKNSRQSLLYCFYTASLLKNYYDGYSPGCAKAIDYSEICDALEKQLKNESVILSKKETLLETFSSDLSALMTVPFSNAKLRALDGKANMQRLSTRFSMITVQQSLLLARQYHCLEGLERMMGRQVNIAALSAPVGVYNALSVGLFGFRFLLNLSMMLKHTFIPSPKETCLTMSERLYEEIKKRHFQMTNDLVWGTINGLCNYAAYFHIAVPVANYLLIGFTVFDVIWLNYLLYQTDESFKAKKEEYEIFLKPKYEGEETYRLAKEQLLQLVLAHEKARSEIVFYIAAASILLGSFTAVFLLAPAVLVPVCFLVCNLSIAMYLSGGQYGAYKEKCLVIKQQQDKHQDVTTDAKKECQTAWDNLGFSMAKNTIMPLAIMGLFTVSFPAAILLTLGYMAYECGYVMRLPELFEPAVPRIG